MKRKAAVISGDIIASTSLEEEDRISLVLNLQHLLQEIEKKYGAYCRLIKGDYIECAFNSPEYSLRVALILKSFIKAFPIIDTPRYFKDNRIKQYRTIGIRQAIGYGELLRLDPIGHIIDGEAIYLSGRFIQEHSSHDKERITIKSSLNFLSNNQRINNQLEPLFELIDVLTTKATQKQCEVLYRKLSGRTESEIALDLNIKQPTVNVHSTSLGWNAIEKAVLFFEDVIRIENNKSEEWE
jgi:hypothetical protein